MIEKILIANRGEIACRIIRTCRKLGIKTVAVYSDADQHALHTQMADEAYPLGANPPQESYLNIPKLINIAQNAHVDAVHPGYGFLSENSDFAEAVRKHGLIFIGPDATLIKQMGNKDQAKDIMKKAGVPVIPGFHGQEQSSLKLAQRAASMLPVMIKAAAGGGGKGMRIVHRKEELPDAIDSARRESKSSFGDETLILEKYLTGARHIEVQVIGDHHGHVVHLFERDCSLQRRHQKIIEEAPAQAMPESTRQSLLATALKAAKAIGYTNAGTFEFLYTPEGKFYFLEMNTRLQVEHPVTEMITGIDLVAWQIHVANGEPLPLDQEALQVKGHAIEARLYAENPLNQFLPSTGQLKALFLPKDDVRIELGVQPNDTIGIYYDPMLAKIIVWGETRAQAIQKLKGALNQVELIGVDTNLAFLREILQNKDFQLNQIHTHYLTHHFDDLIAKMQQQAFHWLAPAALSFLLKDQAQIAQEAQVSSEPNSPWSLCNAWQLNGPAMQTLTLTHQKERIDLVIQTIKDDHYFLTCPKWAQGIEIEGTLNDNQLVYTIENIRQQGNLYFYNHHLHFFQDGISEVYERTPVEFEPDAPSLEAGLTAPMPGVITKLWIKPGSTVHKGDKLLVMEAMKMEHTLEAHREGKIKTVYFQVGDLVDQGSHLFEFDDHD